MRKYAGILDIKLISPSMMAGREAGREGYTEGFNWIFFFKLNGRFMDVHSLYHVVHLKYLIINEKGCVGFMCI